MRPFAFSSTITTEWNLWTGNLPVVLGIISSIVFNVVCTWYWGGRGSWPLVLGVVFPWYRMQSLGIGIICSLYCSEVLLLWVRVPFSTRLWVISPWWWALSPLSIESYPPGIGRSLSWHWVESPPGIGGLGIGVMCPLYWRNLPWYWE